MIHNDDVKGHKPLEGGVLSTVASFESAVLTLEGFRIRIRHGRDGRNVRSDRRLPSTYRYKRQARSEWTITEYLNGRLSKLLPGYNVEVIDKRGLKVNGKTKLRSIRAAHGG